jgi:hypothetical protein
VIHALLSVTHQIAGDLERAANLLGYAKEIGLCLSPPDLFERELAVDPFGAQFYRCRARVKCRAGLREEALVDMTRMLLVCDDEDLLFDQAGTVRQHATDVPLAPWARHALASIYQRLDGAPNAEWRHLVLARDASDDVAVHARMAEHRRGTGGKAEIVALTAVTEQAPGWLEGWLRLSVARTRAGDEVGAHRTIESLSERVCRSVAA